jgi:hypothetical protein
MPIIRLDHLEQFAAVNLRLDPGAIGGPVVIPNCAQIVLNWTLADGKTGHNVTYGRTVAAPAPTVAQAQAIFAALTTGALWTALASHFAVTTSLASVTIRSVHAIEQPIFQSTGAAVPGTAATNALPAEVAEVITLRTALAGKANRGRMYLPGLSVGDVFPGNVIAATAVTDLSAWSAQFIGIYSAQGYTMVIGQKARAAYIGSTGTAHPARAATSTPVVSLSCRNNTWDSQRKRGLK